MVDKLFHCEICRSKVLESRLKKHHAKVHSNIDHDIYKPLSAVGLEVSPNVKMGTEQNQGTENQLTQPMSVNAVWNIEPPKDAGKVHVQCTFCNNKMPAESMNEHMKRKHSEPTDQVDAIGTIGTMVDVMSLDTVGKHTPVAASKTFNAFAPLVNSTSVKMEPKNDLIDFGRNIKPTTSLKHNVEAAADAGPSNEETFYTIRVTEAQMQELLNNNRIYPKKGAFYLK